MRKLIAVALFCSGLFCLAQAQVPMTGAGLGKPASGGGGPYAGPGDAVSGAVVWWGFRAYSLAMAGTKAAKICDAATGLVCTDVNSLANGDFDRVTAAALAQCSVSCAVQKLYDQSGANHCGGPCDMTYDGTASHQPTLVFNCKGSLPCINFNGSSQILLVSIGAIAQPDVFSDVSFAAGGFIAFTGFSGSGQQTSQSGSNTHDFYAGTHVANTAANGAWHAIQDAFNGASSAQNIDGNEFTSLNPGASNTAVCLAFGDDAAVGCAVTAGDSPTAGKVMEGGIWDSALNSTQRNALCHNQSGYYSLGFGC